MNGLPPEFPPSSFKPRLPPRSPKPMPQPPRFVPQATWRALQRTKSAIDGALSSLLPRRGNRLGWRWHDPAAGFGAVRRRQQINPFDVRRERVNLYDVHMVDANVGYAVGDRGTVLGTQDGGRNWARLAQLAPDVVLLGVSFATQDVGIVVGSARAMFWTADGGASWRAGTIPLLNTEHPFALNAVQFLDATTAVAVGEGLVWRYGVVLRTTDAGRSWEWVELPLNSKPLGAVHFCDSQNGVAVGGSYYSGNTYWYGVILRTADGGRSWAHRTVPNDNVVLTGVHCLSPSEIVVVGAEYIHRSTDAGATWTQVENRPGRIVHGFTGVSFDGNGNGIAVGTFGTYFTSVNHGRSWTKNALGPAPTLHAGRFRAARQAVAVGSPVTAVQISF